MERNGGFFSYFAVLLASLLVHPLQVAASTDDERLLAPQSSPAVQVNSSELGDITEIGESVDPKEMYARTQAVLEHFGAIEESWTAPPPEFGKFQTVSSAKGALRFLDLHENAYRFIQLGQLGQLGQEFVSFDDRDAKEVELFRTELADKEPDFENSTLHQALKRASSNASETPLEGLRIALDPGHMGGELWDARTGKYISHAGRKLSEGVMALQTAILLKREFEYLGAEVRLTREDLEPVTQMPWEDLDVTEFARKEFPELTLRSWFQNLLTSAPAGKSLFEAFDQSRHVRRLYSKEMRSRYFILREDLQSRVDRVREFEPHITLVIHFDVVPAPQDPHGVHPHLKSSTKAYIPGAFMKDEYASRAAKSDFAHHLLNAPAWKASYWLSQLIVNQISGQMGIPFDPHGGSVNTVMTGPGVFTRNLALTRRLTGHAVSYLEVMHYNTAEEFDALTKEDFEMIVEERRLPYSKRLREAVLAIRDGVSEFVKTYR